MAKVIKSPQVETEELTQERLDEIKSNLKEAKSLVEKVRVLRALSDSLE